jgi:hypothetical protein
MEVIQFLISTHVGLFHSSCVGAWHDSSSSLRHSMAFKRKGNMPEAAMMQQFSNKKSRQG